MNRKRICKLLDNVPDVYLEYSYDLLGQVTDVVKTVGADKIV